MYVFLDRVERWGRPRRLSLVCIFVAPRSSSPNTKKPSQHADRRWWRRHGVGDGFAVVEGVRAVRFNSVANKATSLGMDPARKAHNPPAQAHLLD